MLAASLAGVAVEGDAKMVRVVMGHICAGKTAWVAAHAKRSDIVIDHDRIALAMSPEGTASHCYTDSAGAVAGAIRWAAIDSAVRVAKTVGVDVWIVHAYPTQADLTMYLRLGAVTRHVVADHATLRSRAAVERPKRMQKSLDERLAAEVSGA